jgi:hypothetical protein
MALVEFAEELVQRASAAGLNVGQTLFDIGERDPELRFLAHPHQFAIPLHRKHDIHPAVAGDFREAVAFVNFALNVG